MIGVRFCVPVEELGVMEGMIVGVLEGVFVKSEWLETISRRTLSPSAVSHLPRLTISDRTPDRSRYYRSYNYNSNGKAGP